MRHGVRSASQYFTGASTGRRQPQGRRARVCDNLTGFPTPSAGSYVLRRLRLLMPGINLHDLLVGLLHGLLSLPVLHQYPVHHAANQIGA